MMKTNPPRNPPRRHKRAATKTVQRQLEAALDRGEEINYTGSLSDQERLEISERNAEIALQEKRRQKQERKKERERFWLEISKENEEIALQQKKNRNRKRKKKEKDSGKNGERKNNSFSTFIKETKSTLKTIQKRILRKSCA